MSHILLGLRGGLYCLDLNRPLATPRPVLWGVQPTALSLDPAVPGRVYCATYDRGLWRSDDAGGQWLPVGMPQDYFGPPTTGALPTPALTFVSVAPAPDAAGRYPIWVGTEPSALFCSLDGGDKFWLVNDFHTMPSRASWSFPPRPATHHVQWLAHGPQAELYVAIEAGALLRSLDGGRTVEDRLPGSPRDIHALHTHPAAPGRLYAATGDGLLQAGHAWAESRDGGNSWQYASRGLEANPYLYGMAVNVDDPDDIRLAAAPSPRAAHAQGGSSIYRATPGGWVEDAAGFPTAHSLVPVLAADSGQPGRWYALSNLGLFQQDPTVPGWQLIAQLPEWESMHPMCFAQFQ